MKTIILSAGHGGHDSGAFANGVKESDANLEIVLACRDYLDERYSGHKLVLPRKTDIFVSLPARRDITVQELADLYVSVHNNSYKTATANGFETFLSSGPLYGNTETIRKIMHDEIYGYLKTIGIRDRGKKHANHHVTRMMPCPTVLIEYMFVSNPREAAHLKNQVILKEMGIKTAIGIAKALSLPMKSVKPTPPLQEDIWYRAVAGSWRNRDSAKIAVDALRQAGYDAFLEVK